LASHITPDGLPLPQTAALDGSTELHICADSVMEFVARLWVENELFFGVDDEPAELDSALAAYAANL
jgi:hypothetical protein